jgi:hypothetical protein
MSLLLSLASALARLPAFLRRFRGFEALLVRIGKHSSDFRGMLAEDLEQSGLHRFL